ncbi:hypothetical protein [Haloferula sargassicola]|uniref:Tetratricopeptide repeat protein n=1 Tax=Haloferula sargassicola TaxID=490096 RepID=A0ABP9ULU1_9BACT
MTAEELARSAETEPQPPADAGPALQALWLAKAGRWDEAHDLCQEIDGPAGAWIHAWLHREEGDDANAGYWYARAGKPAPAAGVSLGDEWFRIARELAG